MRMDALLNEINKKMLVSYKKTKNKKLKLEKYAHVRCEPL